MATESRRKDKIFFSHREATPFTPDTTCFMQGYGTMTFPEPEYQFESNKGKLGAGEHGTKTELQAVWTPWTYSCQRLSEVAYFMSYFQGKHYTVVTDGDLEKHELYGLPVSSRQLDTFTFEYGLGTASGNAVFSGNVVNEINIVLASGGNGIVEATFSGWGNKHRKVANAFALNAAGSMTTATYDIASEPMINFKCSKLWKADSANALRAECVDFTGEDLGANPVDLTDYLSTITITGNNGMNAADMLRAGGCGIVNDRNRGDRVYTVEIGLRKDDTNALDTDALIIADDQMAFELQWNGSIISGSDPYAMDIIFPVVQLQKGTEDDGSPISKTIPLEVFQDSNGDACEVYVQSEVGAAYNALA